MIPIAKLLEESNPIQIYCDMDGVLTDFNASVKKIGYKGPLPARSQEDRDRLWKLVIDNAEKFWGDMPWLPGGKELWKFLEPHNPILCTSVANSMGSKLGREGKKGKQRWIKRELGQKYLDTAIITMSGNKTKNAAPNHILIDDDEPKNIDPWIKAGGIGIVHKSNTSTIKQLREYLDE
jgi:hypothetical protein